MPGARVLFFFDAPVTLRRRLEERTAPMRGVSLRFSGDPGEILELAADADVLVGWRTTPDLLRAARRARLVVNPGAGVQHLVPIFRAHDRAIVLANGHGNAGLTAQHAVALLLALANQIVRHHGFMAAGRFRTGDAEGPSIPLRGRRIGLLGYGAVNRSVHRFLSGFDVSFHVLRRGARDGPTSYVAYGPADLAAFLDAVDTLVVAVPLTDETRGLLGAEELARLGASGLLVNVARGEVVDEGSLYEALRDHTIAGAAIDVWYRERPEPDAAGRRFPFSRPFHELDNVVLSPHRAASPLDDLDRWDDVIENIRRVAEGRGDLVNVVELARGY